MDVSIDASSVNHSSTSLSRVKTLASAPITVATEGAKVELFYQRAGPTLGLIVCSGTCSMVLLLGWTWHQKGPEHAWTLGCLFSHWGQFVPRDGCVVSTYRLTQLSPDTDNAMQPMGEPYHPPYHPWQMVCVHTPITADYVRFPTGQTRCRLA